MDRPLHALTAIEAAGQIRRGRLSSLDYAEALLAQAAAREPVLRAFAHLDAGAVRAQARRRDAQAPGGRGALHGVPLAVKDVIDTADMPTTYGSPIHAGHVPRRDAAVVALARAAGGIVFGKAVTAEFANRAPGPTTNPHDPERTPGGSSSGSAAAVGAGIVPLALGTQTTASVIRPASYCGVHGFKPSWGEISYAGIQLTAASLDTVGLYARSVPDLALLHAVLTATPFLAPMPGNVAAPRIGLCRTPFADQAEPCVHALLDEAARAAEKAGATVVECVLPRPFAGLADAHRWVSAWEGARSLAFEATRHRDRLSADILEGRIRDGEACSVELYRASARLGERCRLEMDALFAEYDALITPAAAGEAPKGLAFTGNAVFGGLWTLLHVPCLSLPGARGPAGMPIGLQLVGPRGGDRRLLELAAWLERAVFG
ncbi:amidase [Crenalkalicoccus roseus]|uniref:amidase n=1 Tax=Crenalkalicoccus roseus TaxID=1485588 RepID=UPI00108205BA|nr:amidase [Crenalkalicoccus roseus]